MHYAAAAVMLGIYMYNLPLTLAVVWRRGGLGVGYGIFDVRGALRRAEGRTSKRSKGGFSIKKLRRALRMLAALIRHMELERFTARLRIGTGDAARTALLCGAVSSAAYALRGAAKSGRVDVRPDFSGEALEGEVRAAAMLKLGRLLRALAESI